MSITIILSIIFIYIIFVLVTKIDDEFEKKIELNRRLALGNRSKLKKLWTSNNS